MGNIKLTEEKFIFLLDDKLAEIQEPAVNFSDKISSLLDRPGDDSVELFEFKMELSEILLEFQENMVTANDEIIAEFGLDNNNNFLA